MAKLSNFSPVTIAAAKQLDDIINSLTDKFSERTDFMRILVNQFENLSEGEENKHLRFFY